MTNSSTSRIVVFDTNIYISAIVFGGAPRLCLELARAKQIQLVVSRAILTELRAKLIAKFAWPEQDVNDVIIGIGQFAQVVNSKEKLTVIAADPADNRVLEAAKAVQADYIISGDKKHILSLGHFGKIKIITASEFIRPFPR